MLLLYDLYILVTYMILSDGLSDDTRDCSFFLKFLVSFCSRTIVFIHVPLFIHQNRKYNIHKS